MMAAPRVIKHRQLELAARRVRSASDVQARHLAAQDNGHSGEAMPAEAPVGDLGGWQAYPQLYQAPAGPEGGGHAGGASAAIGPEELPRAAAETLQQRFCRAARAVRACAAVHVAVLCTAVGCTSAGIEQKRACVDHNLVFFMCSGFAQLAARAYEQLALADGGKPGSSAAGFAHNEQVRCAVLTVAMACKLR